MQYVDAHDLSLRNLRDRNRTLEEVRTLPLSLDLEINRGAQAFVFCQSRTAVSARPFTIEVKADCIVNREGSFVGQLGSLTGK